MRFNRASLILVIVLWVSIAVVGRIIPHPANITPLTALSILSGYTFRKNWAILITLISLCISDMLLGLIQHQSSWGDWSLFTYSGFVLVAALVPQIMQPTSSPTMQLPNVNTANKFFRWLQHGRRAMTKWYQQSIWEYAVIATLSYWLWTNFGTWLTSSMYAHDAQGFFQCYVNALPFLQNSLIGTVIYMLIFLPGVKKILFGRCSGFAKRTQ